MSTTTPKKPPGANGAASNPSTAKKVSANSNSTANSNGTPSRSPSGMAAAAQNTTSTSATGTASAKVDRTRSVRNGAGTPVSARAAARKPATPDPGVEDDVKAEWQAQLADLQARLAESEAAYSSAQKQGEVLQIKLDEALKEQAILEDNVHESTERIEELENERREKERGRREMELIYEAERAAMTREKEESSQREEELQGSIVRMREALQAREIRAGLDDVPFLGERGSRASISRTSSHRLSNSHSPNPPELSPEGASRQFAPSSLQRSDSRSSSRLVMQKDKIIESLRLELAEAQIKLVELENKGGGHVQLLEKEMYDLKIQNARLMEENESFQLLLQEKTLNGDLLRAPSEDKGSRPSSSRNAGTLADELQDDDMNSAEQDAAAPDSAVSRSDSKERRLQGEVNALKDQNKALTLYINNIISRLLQHDQFEAILDKTPDLMAGPGAASTRYQASAPNTDKELPPPPPPKDEHPLPAPAMQAEEGQQAQGMGFLQRAGSVLKRARPQSIIQGQTLSDQQLQPRPEDQTNLHTNPTTAPQIPLSRSRSQRAGQTPHRRSNSDWPAASVVTNMYKGPIPGPSGPLSPGLGSPGTSGRASPFFAVAGRNVSGGAVPTISETERDREKENAFPGPVTYLPRDSKLDARSNRDSVASIPASNQDALNALQAGGGEVSSNPSSPPRSTTSSGDRDAQVQRGGSVMMGSKPRPLRLVQEASAEDERTKKAANRGSWLGWAESKVKGLTQGAAAPGTPPPTGGAGAAYTPGRLGSVDGRMGSHDGRMHSNDGSQGGQ